MEKKDLSRRQLIRNTFAAGGAIGLLASTTSIGAVCGLTVPQQEGPYYPQGDLERDSDLTELEPGMAPAEGQVIFLSGMVMDPQCRPLKDSLVEIWQACATGKYNHSEDTNALKLDTNFQYWGRARTNAQGKYLFKSIIPGHYPTGGGNFRPPHLHFKAYASGFYTLTTQMYFEPATYSDPEMAALVAKLNGLENVPKSLKVHFKKTSETFFRDGLYGEFPLTLRPH